MRGAPLYSARPCAALLLADLGNRFRIRPTGMPLKAPAGLLGPSCMDELRQAAMEMAALARQRPRQVILWSNAGEGSDQEQVRRPVSSFAQAQ